MTTREQIESLLDSFDHLPEEAKREAAAEILRRTSQFDLSPLDDDTLVENAERLFLYLDNQELKNG